DRALALDPRNVAALVGKAGLSLRRGDATAALALLDRAAALDPDDPEIPHRRGQALARLGRAAEARAAHERAARLRRDSAELAAIRDRLVRNPDDRHSQAEL